jgi:hypothetical protein
VAQVPVRRPDLQRVREAPLMGPGHSGPERSEAPKEVPDNVRRMAAILARHKHVTYLRPGQAGVPFHTATWIEADAEDPREDGTTVTVSRMDLGPLCSYLEARLGH